MKETKITRSISNNFEKSESLVFFCSILVSLESTIYYSVEHTPLMKIYASSFSILPKAQDQLQLATAYGISSLHEEMKEKKGHTYISIPRRFFFRIFMGRFFPKKSLFLQNNFFPLRHDLHCRGNGCSLRSLPPNHNLSNFCKNPN